MNKNNSLEVIEDCTTYIKNHLQDTLTAEALASRYGYSLYHFCHIFKICCDMSPGKYIRLLRLEKAKKDILSGMSITQAGFDNGFETSSGFSKAFRKEYGISAREYLKQNKESEVLIMLHVEIKTLQSQTALGYEIPGEYDSDYSKSGAYWNHINFKEYPAYPEGIHDYGEVGLWTHPDHISGELHYFFGFLTDSTDSTEIPDGFHKVEIPAGRYAVFTIKSQETPEKVADAVRDGWRYVFTEWLCTQKEYKISHQGMCFECYQGEETYLYLPVIDL